MPALLAIDPGSHCGWAVHTVGGEVVYGTWRLVDDAAGRLNDLTARLEAAHERYAIGRVGYEAPYFDRRFPTAARPLCHLEGHILSWAGRHGLPIGGYTPIEVKGSVAHARASKEEVMAAVVALGFQPADDHQSDAIALLRLLEAGIPPKEVTHRAAARERRREPDLFTTALAKTRRRSAARKA